ncbi:PhaM family polyhydroxyalkanoate granule multifunctional regulatory protein [Pollutimonas harenae]|uniref:Transcriptional regulator n=1 Tax=Pollutimonas harenae TaxID=657015 RepID=A0A853H3N9_9BURK|nr:PhaM family polyhydroxyalkanoate granule multifunctional regulatory protein [Pollutimonas harenae]NYT84754.1 transcriptional regulator [Pollutimonas harenae]TEA72845.1 transcriptional regulator [Pollutimonas harenae]
MANQPYNPFVLPGFGQSGDLAQNPMMASMEMMRQAWQGLAGAGGFEHSALTPPMSIEDLDRRISDLRAVENWLRMNLSMLSSTIQGLEVQRATIATLKSFAASSATSAGGAGSTGPSPLEVVLGITPAPAASNTPEPSQEQPRPTASQSSNTGETNYAEAPQPDPAQTANAAAAQGWWDMLQKQFDTLAAATAATLQSAEAARAEAAGQSSEHTSSSSTLGRAPRKTAKKTASSGGTRRPAKKAAGKTVTRKRPRSSGETDS